MFTNKLFILEIILIVLTDAPYTPAKQANSQDWLFKQSLAIV